MATRSRPGDPEKDANPPSAARVRHPERVRPSWNWLCNPLQSVETCCAMAMMGLMAYAIMG